MADTPSHDTPPVSRREFLRRAGGSVALGAIGISMTECSAPLPARTSVTEQWNTLADSDTERQQQLADYREAYIAFEKATDEAIREAKQAKGMLLGRLLRGDLSTLQRLDIIFCPSGPNGQEGSCELTSKANNESIGMLPKLVGLFDAYMALCRLQNTIDEETAVKTGISGAPTNDTIGDFLQQRNRQMPSSQRLSKDDIKFIADWLEGPLDTAAKFSGIAPQFGQSEQENTQLAKVDKKEFNHTVTILSMFEIPVGIVVKNPYFIHEHSLAADTPSKGATR